MKKPFITCTCMSICKSVPKRPKYYFTDIEKAMGWFTSHCNKYHNRTDRVKWKIIFPQQKVQWEIQRIGMMTGKISIER